ncbi:MAG: UDP-N-acetylmuramoyl-L-alanyl-D-glutamate--2,6-diaminopimelate ligase, partial [Nitriliruptoraceae bacterium]
DAVAMEVSSHGLDLHRVDGIEFDVAVFTNLSQDHLDWHGSMADYYRAKARLMTPELSRAGVIFIDDDWGRRLADETAVPTVRVGTGTDADVRMRDVHVDAQGGRAEVDWDGASMTVRTSLVGAFNVCNAVLAVVAAVVAGVPRDAACAGVAACSTIAGRLQRVDEGQPFAVYVDYAHTPAAVAQAITTLRGVHPDGRVIAVLGAGGDRDRSKRVPMGRALAEADVAVVTSDNPRSEDPAAIADELIAGVRDATRGGRNAELIVELDRHDAIQKAIAMARVGDVVLVAGKGHERQQVIADDVRTFDDVAVARMCLREVVA